MSECVPQTEKGLWQQWHQLIAHNCDESSGGTGAAFFSTFVIIIII